MTLPKTKRQLAWEAKVYPVPSNVDAEQTLAVFGYPAQCASPGSPRKVMVRCRVCSTLVAAFRKNVTDEYRCQPCSQRDPVARSRRVDGIKAALKRSYPLLPQLSEEETYKAYGYLASEVKPTSSRWVVYRCAVCSSFRKNQRYQVRDGIRCKSCAAKDDDVSRRRRETFLAVHGVADITQLPRKFGKQENDLAAYLRSLLPDLDLKKYRLPSTREIDIFIPSLHLGIEYHGLFWHTELSPQPRTRNFHFEKLQEANRQSIRLVSIFSDEWLQRRGAVESRLRSIVGHYNQRLFARKCQVREIPLIDAYAFLEATHVQGASFRSLFALGLYHAEVLVGVMTFAMHHRQSRVEVRVLDRLCFAPGVHVVGGASKLFAHAAAYFQPRGVTRIISWSDRRWSEGGVYRALGFDQEAVLPPDYSYVNLKKPEVRLSKQSQKKSSSGCPADKTEVEWAAERGLARVWDCGHVRWGYDLR